MTDRSFVTQAASTGHGLTKQRVRDMGQLSF
jgi:hypothetical protein